jgi:hypothetical protein
MSRTVVIRYETHADAADTNQGLVEWVFAELHEKTPDGVRYATFRLQDGVRFLHVVRFDGEGNPLADLPAFAAFQADIGDRLVAPPVSTVASLVGSYRFLTG